MKAEYRTLKELKLMVKTHVLLNFCMLGCKLTPATEKASQLNFLQGIAEELKAKSFAEQSFPPLEEPSKRQCLNCVSHYSISCAALDREVPP